MGQRAIVCFATLGLAPSQCAALAEVTMCREDRSSFIEAGRFEGLPRGRLVVMKRTVEPAKFSDPFFIPRAGPGFREL